jgi:hypothetical protein
MLRLARSAEPRHRSWTTAVFAEPGRLHERPQADEVHHNHIAPAQASKNCCQVIAERGRIGRGTLTSSSSCPRPGPLGVRQAAPGAHSLTRRLGSRLPAPVHLDRVA